MAKKKKTKRGTTKGKKVAGNGKAPLVCRNVFQLAKHPSVREIETTAKAMKACQLIRRVTQPDLETLQTHAEEYFRTHPNVNQLLYEVYEKNGRILRSSREPKDPPPEGDVRWTILAHNKYVKGHVRSPTNYVSMRLIYSPDVTRKTQETFRRLALKNAGVEPS